MVRIDEPRVCDMINVLIRPESFNNQALWAIIEPPIFILTGCLLTLGPLIRNKMNLRNPFKSLRTYLLKRSTRKSTQTSNQPESAGTNSPHPWRVLQEPAKGDGRTRRAHWELSDIETVSKGSTEQLAN